MTLQELVDSAPNRNDVLGALGLSTRRSPTDDPLLAAGIFGAGVLLGVAVGVLFAPRVAASVSRRRAGNGANSERAEFESAVPQGA